ncbi:MAG TPA: SRPBCC family protein [Egibacteraceae bacterium]|nr:SRPBCC family protein [Egibacteraceae bacterium]
MPRFSNTIEIARPPEEVFAFLADHRNVPRWNYFVRTVRALDGTTPALGARYHQVRRDDEQTFQITEWSPGRSFTIATLPGQRPAFERTMRFTSTPGGVRIDDAWLLDIGQPRLLEPMLAQAARRGVGDNLARLRELLENGRTRLQDGRLSVLAGSELIRSGG